MYNKEDQVAALASFDSYYDLLMLLDPNPLEEKFVQLDIFPDGEQHLCSDEEAACCPKIDALLKKARSIIVSKGAAMFIEMVKIISQMKTCKELAYHLIGKCNNFLSTHSGIISYGTFTYTIYRKYRLASFMIFKCIFSYSDT